MRTLRFKGFRQALSTLSPPRCSDEEVHAASKLMLTTFSLRARLLVFVLLPDPMYCQQEWRAWELQKTMMAGPLILVPGVGTTCISTLRLLISPLLPPSVVKRMDSLQSFVGSSVSQNAIRDCSHDTPQWATSLTVHQPFGAAQIVHWVCPSVSCPFT